MGDDAVPVEAQSMTAQEITDELGQHPQTFKTYLSRLAKMGAVMFHHQGRAYIYRPLVQEKHCQAAESSSFLDRVFGGSVHLHLSHRVENEQLSDAEIE